MGEGGGQGKKEWNQTWKRRIPHLTFPKLVLQLFQSETMYVKKHDLSTCHVIPHTSGISKMVISQMRIKKLKKVSSLIVNVIFEVRPQIFQILIPYSFHEIALLCLTGSPGKPCVTRYFSILSSFPNEHSPSEKDVQERNA